MTVDKRTLILIGIIVILVTVLLITLFKGSSKDDQYYEQLLAAKDSVISSLHIERQTLEAEILEREISLEAFETLDSIIYSHYKQQQKIYSLLDAKIKNIPAIINGLRVNNDSIRTAFRDF